MMEKILFGMRVLIIVLIVFIGLAVVEFSLHPELGIKPVDIITVLFGG